MRYSFDRPFRSIGRFPPSPRLLFVSRYEMARRDKEQQHPIARAFRAFVFYVPLLTSPRLTLSSLRSPPLRLVSSQCNDNAAGIILVTPACNVPAQFPIFSQFTRVPLASRRLFSFRGGNRGELLERMERRGRELRCMYIADDRESAVFRIRRSLSSSLVFPPRYDGKYSRLIELPVYRYRRCIIASVHYGDFEFTTRKNTRRSTYKVYVCARAQSTKRESS